MKDYKLSELKLMCKQQRSKYHNCSHCPVQQHCDDYFGYSYSPSMWDIDEEEVSQEQVVVEALNNNEPFVVNVEPENIEQIDLDSLLEKLESEIE